MNWQRPLELPRRAFLQSAGAAAAGAAAAACAPAVAPPEPGAAPAAGKAQWEVEWERLIGAAKQEGKLSVLTLVGVGHRQTYDTFEEAFGIAVDHQSFPSASVFGPKVLAERQAGIYSFDAAVIAPGSALRELKPQGVWDPVRPVLFRPDITADSLWPEGFEAQFIDLDRRLAFAWDHTVTHSFAVDTNQVRPEEIKSVRDMLNPKWKGKMLFSDVRVGDTRLAMTAAKLTHGEEVVKKLLIDQEPTFTRDIRGIVEAAVRGRHPIVLGARIQVLKEFVEQGLGKNVKHLDLPDGDFMPRECVFLFNRAPHPNAAKLFINWVLTKQASGLLARNLGFNSARTDVPPVNPETYPKSLKEYKVTNKEEIFPEIEAMAKFLADLTEGKA